MCLFASIESHVRPHLFGLMAERLQFLFICLCTKSAGPSKFFCFKLVLYTIGYYRYLECLVGLRFFPEPATRLRQVCHVHFALSQVWRLDLSFVGDRPVGVGDDRAWPLGANRKASLKRGGFPKEFLGFSRSFGRFLWSFWGFWCARVASQHVFLWFFSID